MSGQNAVDLANTLAAGFSHPSVKALQAWLVNQQKIHGGEFAPPKPTGTYSSSPSPRPPQASSGGGGGMIDTTHAERVSELREESASEARWAEKDRGLEMAMEAGAQTSDDYAYLGSYFRENPGVSVREMESVLFNRQGWEDHN
jgi:hypothetical protein